MHASSTAVDRMWRPPVNRMMRTLDRGFFQRTIPLKAARVHENRNISKCRAALERSKDALAQDRLSSVVSDPDPELAKAGRKCIILQPKLSAQSSTRPMEDDSERANEIIDSLSPHSPTVASLVEQQLVSLIPFDLHLDYSYWTYGDIMTAILPEDEQGEIPSGFTQVGHVAHLNLRDEYLKHKHLIAEVLVDKVPSVTTVINKVDDVGEENEFRTFRYEVLAGPDDMNVTVSEENCIFRFDYSKVYWNSRLHTEHRRLVSSFKEGEAVCDLMAGIGPFAVPAGKRKIFVWANDLNPDSYKSLQDAIARNKVQQFVRPFNSDARSFVHQAVKDLAASDYSFDIRSRASSSKDAQGPPAPAQTFTQPKTFQHFVLNLPATALSFLPSFIGMYPPAVRQLLPADISMPLVHAYCFSTKSDDNAEEARKICAEISGYLQHELRPGSAAAGGVEVHDVRDVAPKKRMFCASFRLPREVAYRSA